MDKVIDARGLACPQPVVNTKKALDELTQGTLVTVVDNKVARDNVIKFAQSQSLEVQVEEKGDEYFIHITRNEVPGYSTQSRTAIDQVLLVSSSYLGRGDDELGALLMQNFLGTLALEDCPPGRVYLINSAVKLACEGSPVLSSLMALEQKGVALSSCGLCLDHFNLKEKLCVGTVTNMYDIVETVAGAARVINL